MRMLSLGNRLLFQFEVCSVYWARFVKRTAHAHDSLSNGFRFFFYTHEGNEPPHIHVIGRGGEIKLWLNPIEIAAVYHLSFKDQRDALKITSENANLFLEKWREWHGPRNTKR
jgi:hypothetical protein